MTVRDSQRSKLYRAERAWRSAATFKTFDDIDEIAEYVGEFVESPYIERRYGKVAFTATDTDRTIGSAAAHTGRNRGDLLSDVPTITVGRRLSNAAACCRSFSWRRHSLLFPNPRSHGVAVPTGNGYASAPSWAYTEPTVLHEVAHALTYIEAKQTHGIAGHGREFARVSLDLIGRKLGREAKATLKQAYRDHGVKFTKAGRKLTPEQRERAAAILAEARAKAAANRAQA